MSSDELSPQKRSLGENQTVVGLFRLLVSALLGIMIAVGQSIMAAQRDQAKQLEDISASIKVSNQINTDFGRRLKNIEQREDDDARALAILNGRVLVLEAMRPARTAP